MGGLRATGRRGSSWSSVALLAAFALGAEGEAHAQESDGSAWAAIGGGALGLYSGATLGLLGSLTPCSQTYAGAKCVRIVTIAGGAVGLVSGVMLGAADRNRIGDHARDAGFGVLIGAGVGMGLRPFIQRFGWQDVTSMALAGGAIGASAKGAGIGFAAGSLVGLALWQIFPGFDLPDVVATALAGMAIGGVGALATEGVDRQTSDVPALHVIAPLTLSF